MGIRWYIHAELARSALNVGAVDFDGQRTVMTQKPCCDRADGATSAGNGSADDARTIAFLRLHLATIYSPEDGIGLLDHAGGDPRRVDTAIEALRSRGKLRPAVARRLASSDIAREAERELETTRREGIRILCRGEPDYPSRLECLAGQPVVLFVRGQLPMSLSSPTIGIVGSRRPSPYGLRQARRFASELAGCGAVIVSGLARGVDAEAHRATLEASGATIAVLGSGWGRLYPREHSRLAEEIVERGGAVLTPFPFTAAPRAFHFPMRNAILSGLSRILLVVEAGWKSGTLITVHHALEQGATVFALPGPVDREESAGCLRLLRDGAAVAVEPSDLVEALAFDPSGLPPGMRETLRAECRSAGAPEDSLPSDASALAHAIVAALRSGDAESADALADVLSAPPSAITAELSRLESEGRVRRLPGGLVAIR